MSAPAARAAVMILTILEVLAPLHPVHRDRLQDDQWRQLVPAGGAMKHGYGPYTRGCRCDTCRKAKAAYMRARRTDARDNAGGTVEGITHGTRFAWEERGCRCSECERQQLARHQADWSRRQEDAWDRRQEAMATS